MFRKGWRYLRICYAINLRLSVVLLFVVMAVGEVGCFFWVYFTWRIPAPSSDSLNLLLVSDSQIQGYRNEPSGTLGYITRLDADWYLWKAFMLVMTAYSPDAVIHLGDIFDEGNIATDDEFLQYKARHNKIFNVGTGVYKIHVAGDNDIGGEGMDSITQDIVARFSQHFGSINEVIELKSFQIVKVNSVSLKRIRPFKDEQAVYNKTLAFIEELPSKINKDQTAILIGHVTLNMINNKKAMTKLINAVQPRYAFSGDIHESATLQHQIGDLKFTEHVVPTCSYRMGTDKMGVMVAVLGVDGSLDYSVLPLPTRYTFFRVYLDVIAYCVVSLLPWLITTTVQKCYKTIRKKRPLNSLIKF